MAETITYQETTEVAFYQWLKDHTAVENNFLHMQNIMGDAGYVATKIFTRSTPPLSPDKLAYIQYHPVDPTLHRYYIANA